jgi:hypothetical protein
MAKLLQYVKDYIVPLLFNCQEVCLKEKTVWYDRPRIHLYICQDHMRQIAYIEKRNG